MNASEGMSRLQRMIADVTAGSQRGTPPVETWNPPFCGDIDMEIRADGTWFYLGTPIGRMPLVKLFASVLRKDDDGNTYLVTPVEKIGIRVEDAHFVAVEMAVQGEGAEQTMTLRTNMDELINVGADNRLRFVIEEETLGLKPYVHIRGRLEALVSRALMYDIVALGEHLDIDGISMFCVRSGGEIFPIMESAALEKASA